MSRLIHLPTYEWTDAPRRRQRTYTPAEQKRFAEWMDGHERVLAEAEASRTQQPRWAEDGEAETVRVPWAKLAVLANVLVAAIVAGLIVDASPRWLLKLGVFVLALLVLALGRIVWTAGPKRRRH